jgi:hypothetical protein
MYLQGHVADYGVPERFQITNEVQDGVIIHGVPERSRGVPLEQRQVLGQVGLLGPTAVASDVQISDLDGVPDLIFDQDQVPIRGQS